MNLQFYLQISITALVAVVSWIVAHRFTSARDLQNRRRQLRTERLIEVYIKLDRNVSRNVTAESLCDLEDAVSLLQLLGSRSEIETTINTAISLTEHLKNDRMNIDGFIIQLRNALREEIGLENYDGPIARIRITYQGHDPREVVSQKQLLESQSEQSSKTKA